MRKSIGTASFLLVALLICGLLSLGGCARLASDTSGSARSVEGSAAQQHPAAPAAATSASSATATASVIVAPAASPSATATASVIVAPAASPSATATATVSASPTASPVPAVRLAVIGDYGLAGEAAQAVSDLVKSWSPDSIITTGDNNYPAGSAETIDDNIGRYYHQFIESYQGRYGEGAETNRFFPALGNHDWQTARAGPYLDYFTLPGNERYYSFGGQQVQLFALDSMFDEPDGVSPSSAQGQWLKEKLAASRACWKIVYMHHPPYSSGHHGSSGWMQWPFADWGADVVMAGHDHTYERIERDGIVYFVNGLGGGARYAFKSQVQGSQVRFNADHGAMLLEIDRSELRYSFVTHGGTLIDTGSLPKKCGA